MFVGTQARPHGLAEYDASRLEQSLIGQAKPSSLLWTKAPDGPRRVELFGLNIENTTLPAAAQEIVNAARDGHRTRVVFANAHVINTAKTDPAYRAAVASASRIYADGSGMAIAGRLAGRPLAANVNGTDILPLLCQEAIRSGTRIFFLGGKRGVAAKAARNLAGFGLGAAVADTYHGYFVPESREEDVAVARINTSRAKIVLVGLGVPLQERWAERNAGRIDAPVIAGVGGLFDFFAGEVARSPKIMRSFGCEWMWRLAMEPERMAHRYLVGNTVFMGYALRQAVAARVPQLPGNSAKVNVSETTPG